MILRMGSTIVLSALLLLCTSVEGSASPINLALNGTATQSTTYFDADASRAIDGNTNGDYWADSVSHTWAEPQAWWRVDLGASFDLYSITLWNRTDCCNYRLRNFRVSVLDAGMAEVWSQDFLTNGGYFDPSLDINLPINISGRHVQVQYIDDPNRSEQDSYLHLAEVQVFGGDSVSPEDVTEPSSVLLLACGFVTLGFTFGRRKIRSN